MAMKGDGVGGKYDTAQDRESAYEKLTSRAESPRSQNPANDEPQKGGRAKDSIATKTVKAIVTSVSYSVGSAIANAIFGGGRKQSVGTRAAKSAVRNAASSIGRNVGNEILRGVLGSRKR